MKYKPETREQLKELVDNFDINLGDIDTSLITDMSMLFASTDRIDFSGIENWNVSSVEDMKLMFRRARNFNSDISNWNVSRVKNFCGMFEEAICFNKPLDNWNTSRAENMNSMFEGAISFNQPLNNWDMSNIKEIRWMFFKAENFEQNLDDWKIHPEVDCLGAFDKSGLKINPKWYKKNI